MQVAFTELSKKGFETDSLGLFDNDSGDISNADIVLLPVPTTRDGKNIFCPITNKVIPLELVKSVKKDTLVLSCGYTFDDICCIDYLKLESFSLLNAVPTAEGAIAHAINDTDFCLADAKVLVIGNGKVGKILADRLKGLKCDITVSARNANDFAYIEAMGTKYIQTSFVPLYADHFDIIFNTVDANILNCCFDKLKNCYIYDLSTKGCLDFELAQNMGIKAVKLPGLPGKTAPTTAGKIIAKTVIDIASRGNTI